MDTGLSRVLLRAAQTACGGATREHALGTQVHRNRWPDCLHRILAEGAIALSVTLSGGALFAS